MHERDSEIKKTISNFLDNKSSTNMLFSQVRKYYSLKEYFNVKFPFLMALPLSIFIYYSPETISVMEDIIDKSFSLTMDIFWGLFTVYALALAFINKDNIKRLIEAKSGTDNTLSKIFSYYTFVLMNYFFSFLVLYFLNIMNPLIIEIYRSIPNPCYAKIAGIMFIFMFLSWFLRLLYELKSMIYNTVVLAKITSVFTMIDILKDDNSKTDK